MKITLTFTVSIRAPRHVVWETMLGAETYKAWTAVFTPGSYFDGSWEQGSRILFLAPNGDGMVSEIAESQPYERLSIRHVGEILNGVEDTTSERVRSWAPAYEIYAFAESDGVTDVQVTIDTLPDYEQFMLDTYPKALDVLKTLCERDPQRVPPPASRKTGSDTGV